MSARSSRNRKRFPEVRFAVETEPAQYSSSGFRAPYYEDPDTGEVIELGPASGQYTRTRPSKIEVFTEAASVSTTTSIGGKAEGSITLASHRDVLHNKARRSIPREVSRQKEISEYLSEVLKVSSLTEIDPRRRALSPGTSRILGIDVEKLGRYGRRLLYALVSANGHESKGQQPQSRSEEYATYEWYIANFKRMRRVWVDMKDADGRWVAVMTGIISSITDTYRAGSAPMVTLNLSGMIRFYEITEIITQQALQNLEWPFRDGVNDFPVSAQSNYLGGLAPDEVFLEMARQVNSSMTLTGAPWKFERRPSNYYYQDPLFKLDNPTSLDLEIGGRAGEAVNPERTITKTTTTPDLTPKIIVDPEIVSEEGNRAAVYREAIRNAFSLYTFENTTAARVAMDAAMVVNYDFFEDPRGNVCIWAPRYDSLPRVSGERAIPESARSKFGDDYSTLPFHDEHYIIDDAELQSWSLNRSEESIKTFVRVAAQPHLIRTPNGDILAVGSSGYTSFDRMSSINPDIAEEVEALASRFGIRRHTLPTFSTGAAFKIRDFLDRYAYAGLVRLNAYAYAGTVTLLQKPELWPARNVFLVERQKLGYVSRVTNELTPGRNSHTTTISVAYVHHPSQRIGIPWWEAENVNPHPKIEGILNYAEP